MLSTTDVSVGISCLERYFGGDKEICLDDARVWIIEIYNLVQFLAARPCKGNAGYAKVPEHPGASEALLVIVRIADELLDDRQAGLIACRELREIARHHRWQGFT